MSPSRRLFFGLEDSGKVEPPLPGSGCAVGSLVDPGARPCGQKGDCLPAVLLSGREQQLLAKAHAQESHSAMFTV